MTDDALSKAARRVQDGKVDADLGAFLVKQRLSQGGGQHGGTHRAIPFHRIGDRVVFLHLFAKSDRANIGSNEKSVIR